MRTGILTVSFGTTYLDTLNKTIAAVEKDISAAFPDIVCYRAFTSGIVRSRLKSKYNICVDSAEEAMERMKADGVEHVVVQPTLIIPGGEYDRLRSKILLNAGNMKVSMGLPLLWDDNDIEDMIRTLAENYPLPEDTVLLAMGHGTDHGSNCFYIRLADRMERLEGKMALCTVEGKPNFEDAIELLKAQDKRKVHLVPLLLVAGDHSENDMAGDEDGSLRSLLEKEGFEVSWSLRGLGEIPHVRKNYVHRAREAYDRLVKE